MVILKEKSSLNEADEITSMDKKEAVDLILSIAKDYGQIVATIYPASAGFSSQTGKYDKVKVQGNMLLLKSTRLPENQMALFFNEIVNADTKTESQTGIQYVRLLLKTKFYVTISGKIPTTARPVW
jgi:hypothetical protein